MEFYNEVTERQLNQSKLDQRAEKVGKRLSGSSPLIGYQPIKKTSLRNSGI